MIFQSTLPARGATTMLAFFQILVSDFNPRSPHGERRKRVDVADVPNQISIHAPRTGSDGGADGVRLIAAISIHAPRTGSDT